ncbi:MAG: spherulation-specific family 4 protein, partial [Nitrososphaerales archaeon]
MVVLYTFPTDPSWARCAAEKAANPSVPMICVINPDSGPGRASQAAYVTGIQTLQAAGITVLGYAYT